MRNLLILFISLLLATCGTGNQSKKTAILSGQITNPAIESITLSGEEFLQKAPLENGAFSVTVNLTEPGYYKLWHDRHQALLFLAPGMSVNLSVDADHFVNTLAFTGQGEAENNVLAREQVFKEERGQQMGRSRKLFSRKENSYSQALASIYDPLLADLDAAAPGLMPEFTELERMRLTYERAHQLLAYPALHAKATSNDTFSPSPAYFRFLQELDFNNPRALKTDSFRDFLPELIAYRTGGADLDPNERVHTEFDYIQESITEAPIRDYALFAVIRNGIRRDGAHILPPTVDQFRELCSDERLSDEIEQEYAKWRKLVPGQPAGDYSFADLNGGSASIGSLQGKYVLMEVWASWCAVCREEYPFLEALHEKFSDKDNLAFAGVSIDENDSSWRYLVRSKQMPGLHFLAAGGWSAQICQDFQINSLPRFILLDPQGRIIDYDAPRPSSGRLESILEELTEGK